MAALFARRVRCALAAAAFAVALTTSGCGGDDDFSLPDWDAPGQNARIGDIMIRYAHVPEPRGKPWQPGSDVPAYVWLYNKGSEADKLLGASTPNATSVDIVDSDGKPLPDGVDLPMTAVAALAAAVCLLAAPLLRLSGFTGQGPLPPARERHRMSLTLIMMSAAKRLPKSRRNDFPGD
ncbi:hypothetical protein ACF07S_32680 [Streptomyces sp. NPDC016640]|uniref:hypothetical protein n=1 Tax=Streptomyces sp. NPDC016640 TaxID=3364969 RepID=UPI00370158D6